MLNCVKAKIYRLNKLRRQLPVSHKLIQLPNSFFSKAQMKNSDALCTINETQDCFLGHILLFWGFNLFIKGYFVQGLRFVFRGCAKGYKIFILFFYLRLSQILNHGFLWMYLHFF